MVALSAKIVQTHPPLEIVAIQISQLPMIFLLWKIIATVGTLMLWVPHIVRKPVMTSWVHFVQMKTTFKHAILMAVQVKFKPNQAILFPNDAYIPQPS